MSKQSFSLLHCLRTMSGAYRQDARNDAELIERFVATHDETAVATLAVRHGPMVWEICRRILGNDADAEDAYQVAFLALAKKAPTIRVTDTVAGWLCHVARQSALNGRKAKKTRQKLQKNLQNASREWTAAENRTIEADESCAILYEELAKLSEKQRVVLVLHYLEGKTQDEVAEILCVGQSAVQDRLNRGKTLLLQRLTHRGLTLGAGGLATMLEAASSHAAVPLGLVAKTVRAATVFQDGKLTGGLAKLAEEVLRHAPAAPWWKAGWMVALLWVGGLGLGAGGVAWKAGLWGGKQEKPLVVDNQRTPQQGKTGQSTTARYDLYGDPLPAHALARVGTARLWHRAKKGNLSLVFSPDGKAVACHGGDMPACLWDAVTGKELFRLQDPDFDEPLAYTWQSSLAFSPDGRILVTATAQAIERTNRVNQKIRLWQTATGKLLRTYDLSIRQWGEPQFVAGAEAVVLPSGEILTLLVQRIEQDRKVKDNFWVWEATTGKKISELQRRGENSLSQVIFSPDGKILATQDGNKGAEIYLWETSTGKEIRRLTPDRVNETSGGNSRLAFSSDGKTLAGGYFNIWNVDTGEKTRSSAGRKKFVQVLAYSQNGKAVYGRSYELQRGEGLLWDVSRGKTRPLGGPCPEAAAFSSDGRILATVCGSGLSYDPVDRGAIRLWDVATGRELGPCSGSRGGMDSLAYSSNGKTLIALGRRQSPDGLQRDWRLSCWDITQGKEIFHHGPIRMRDFSCPLLSQTGDTVIANARPIRARTVPSIDATVGCEVRIIDPPWTRVMFPDQGDVILSPDGKLIAARISSANRRLPAMVHIWNVATRKEICLLSAGDLARQPWKGVFSPDNRTLASLGKDETVCLWDLSAQKCVRILNEKSERPPHVEDILIPEVFSPDGELLVAVHKKWVDIGGPHQACVRTASLWEAATGKRICNMPVPNEEQVSAKFAFSPDGMILAVAGSARGEIHLYDVPTARPICQLRGHRDVIRSLVFSPDNRTLASSSDDKTALIWDVTSLGESASRNSARSIDSSSSEEELDAAWRDLGNPDPAKAYRAVRLLKETPSQAVALLQARVRPVDSGTNSQQVRHWIADLDNSRFAARQKAERAIEDLGEAAVPKLKQALKGPMPLEMRRRVESLLAKVESTLVGGSTERLRGLRAVQVLEHIGTPKARQTLQTLAQGMPEARLTRQAQAALHRMNKSAAGKL